MIIENKFEIGQSVYLKTDNEQRERIVCALRVVPGAIIYLLACGSQNSDHYDFEISEERVLINN